MTMSILRLAEHGSDLDFRLNSASLFFASGSLKDGFCVSMMPFIKCFYCFSPMLTSWSMVSLTLHSATSLVSRANRSAESSSKGLP